MAKRKRKTSGRSTASRRKNRTQDRMPAGLITLFAGLVLMALAFVPGCSAWRTMHDVLFGVFGCGRKTGAPQAARSCYARLAL